MMSALKIAYELPGQRSNIKCGTQYFQWAETIREHTNHLHHMPETVHHENHIMSGGACSKFRLL